MGRAKLIALLSGDCRGYELLEGVCRTLSQPCGERRRVYQATIARPRGRAATIIVVPRCDELAAWEASSPRTPAAPISWTTPECVLSADAAATKPDAAPAAITPPGR